MKQLCTVSAGQLLSGLAKVTPIIPANATIPVLELIHVKVLDKALVLRATNLDTSIATGIKATGHAKTDFLLARQIVPILKNIPKDAQVTISQDENNPHSIDIAVGDSIRATLASDKASTYPVDDAIDGDPLKFEIPLPKDFRSVLQLAIPFTSKDDLRPAMTGVNIQKDAIAATDAHRCIVAGFSLDVASDINIVASKAFIAALDALDGGKPWKVQCNNDKLSMTDSVTKVTTRLIDAPFPNYKAVMPDKKDFKLHIEFDKSAFLTNLNITDSCANKKTKAVLITLQDGKYTLTGQDEDLAMQAHATGNCNYSSDITYVFSMNSELLRTLIALVDGETLTLDMINPKKAVQIVEGGYTMIQMPLMLKDN